MSGAYHPEVSPPRPLPAVVKAALGALVSVVLLGASEVLLRVAGVPDPGLYEGDPAWLWFLRPDLDRDVDGPTGRFHVRTNADGLRGVGPPESGAWTLVLGCSTTFGWGVEGQEAWPAQLSDRLGEVVVNGGVPGWSTVQAVRGAGRWLDAGPDRVVLAYGVRDAWPSARPDAAAHRTHPLLSSHLGRLVRGLIDPRPTGAAPTAVPPETGIWRVSPEDFADNIRQLVARSGDAEVHLLWFPQQTEREAWRQALEDVGPVIAPRFMRTDFLPDDPVHLTAAGHDKLAATVAEAINAEAGPARTGTPPAQR